MWEKRERGSNNIFTLILRLWDRISSGEEGKGGNLRFKKAGGKENQAAGEYIKKHPWL